MFFIPVCAAHLGQSQRLTQNVNRWSLKSVLIRMLGGLRKSLSFLAFVILCQLVGWPCRSARINELRAATPPWRLHNRWAKPDARGRSLPMLFFIVLYTAASKKKPAAGCRIQFPKMAIFEEASNWAKNVTLGRNPHACLVLPMPRSRRPPDQ
jgi:hypothetical protein